MFDSVTRIGLVSCLGAALWMATPTQSTGQTSSQITQAQSALSALGFDPGPADGLWGGRTDRALRAFLDGLGEAFDGTLSENELAMLARALDGATPELGNPGYIVDPALLAEGQCFGRLAAIQPDADVPAPFPAFNDSTSIEDSLENQKERSWEYERYVIANATFGATGDGAALEAARVALLTWAQAEAGLGTAQDRRYLGSGSGTGYDAAALAPILDMENAARLGYSAAVAHSLIRDQLEDAENAILDGWTQTLWQRYGDAFEYDDQPAPTGIYSLFQAPASMAALRGDEAAYQAHLAAAFNMIRTKVAPDGAILRNAERGDRAMLYQAIGILGIASLWDVIERQGGSVPPDIEAALHRAVGFFLAAEADISTILPYA